MKFLQKTLIIAVLATICWDGKVSGMKKTPIQVRQLVPAKLPSSKLPEDTQAKEKKETPATKDGKSLSTADAKPMQIGDSDMEKSSDKKNSVTVKSVSVPEEYVNMIKEANGVDHDFTNVLESKDSSERLHRLIKHYNNISKEASIEEVCCLGLIRQKSSSSDLKEERKEAQARLNSCRLKWYRAREELLAMLLEFINKEDASNSDLQSCMKDVVSILRGSMMSDDMIQKIEEAAGARKTSEDESAPSEK